MRERGAELTLRGYIVVCAVIACASLPQAQRVATLLAPQQPVRIFGNSYYVGTRGLSSILITSDQGHILIDAPMGENVPIIAANVRTLGFRLEDVKLILNSHPHFDHAGGMGELQRLTGASVAARAPTAKVFTSGESFPDDPQFGISGSMKPVARVRTIKDDETVRVGRLAVTAMATGGHTPGGTSWRWQACEGPRCLSIVYADSLGAISADNFLFTNSQAYPTALQDFDRGFAALEATPCDILVTPHPEASNFWDRVVRRDRGGDANGLVDTAACRRYVERARERLRQRVETEKQ